jgi:hypothetical protein
MSNQIKVLGVSVVATGVVIGINHIAKGKIPFYVLGGIAFASIIASAIYFEKQKGGIFADDNSKEQ